MMQDILSSPYKYANTSNRGEMVDIKAYYHDPKFSGSFGGKRRFYKALKAKFPNVKRKEVEQFFRSDDAYTLHRGVQKPRKYRRVYSKGIDYCYNLDLVDMSSLADENRGFKWILVCICTFSRRVWCFKTKNKRGQTITEAIRGLLTTNRPKKIECDSGSEFVNKHFKTMLQKLRIKMYHVYSIRKGALVERYIRTMKTKMFKMFTAQGSHVWHDKLDDLVKSYNNSYHRSIKRTPMEVTHANEAEVRDILYPKLPPPKKPVFKLGDTVRITRKLHVFQKKYKQLWSYEVFYISEILNSTPTTYKIEDFNKETIKGCFYENELQIVDKSSNIYAVERIIRRRQYRGRAQYLVKFQGYPDSFNSWIDQTDLFDI
jgi:hypothetical protein